MLSTLGMSIPLHTYAFYQLIFVSKKLINFVNFMCRQDNVVQCVNREEQGSKDSLSKGNDSDQQEDSRVGFNVLDAMLKHSLDRLKSMRFVRNFVRKFFIFYLIVELISLFYNFLFRDRKEYYLFSANKGTNIFCSVLIIDDFEWHMIGSVIDCINPVAVHCFLLKLSLVGFFFLSLIFVKQITLILQGKNILS